jgi:putative NADPH-quinone reductase
MVVQAHPLNDSYNAALLASVCSGLDSHGDAYVLFRLGEGERPTADDLTGVERLVLVYPTWNSGQPAMLLDWLQQMLGADGLRSIVHVQVATTHGSSKFVNMMQGAWGRRFLAERIIASCAPGARFDWHALYKIDRRSFDETTAFLEETKRHFSAAQLPAR